MKQSFLELIMFVLLLFVCFSKTKAQEKNTISANLYGEIFNHPIGYKGLPYLNENWHNGKVYLKNGTIAENVRMKFNILTNDLVFYNYQINRMFTIDKNTVVGFTLKSDQTDSLFFIKYEGGQNNFRIQNNNFVQVLQNGNVSFWVKHTAEISKSNDINSLDMIYPKEIYFIKTDKGIYDIKLRIKSIIKLFPDRKQEIKRLVSTNRIKNKSASSIAVLVGLLNSTK